MNSEYEPDRRIELNEYNLFRHVQRGPTQLTRGLDSSMLEQAHERQFAISQMGLVSTGFESEHTARIKLALHTVLCHVSKHQHDTSTHRPASPYREYLADFSQSNLHMTFEPLPPFSLEASTIHRPANPPTIPRPTATHPSRSPLALVNLMNPEPAIPKPGKRKYSGSRSSPPVDVDSLDNIVDADTDKLYNGNPDYYRASQSHKPRLTRTHREVRMRRPSPSRMVPSQARRQKPCEADHAENKAHPLLGLSQHGTKAASQNSF
jgi:hypothetical protein